MHGRIGREKFSGQVFIGSPKLSAWENTGDPRSSFVFLFFRIYYIFPGTNFCLSSPACNASSSKISFWNDETMKSTRLFRRMIGFLLSRPLQDERIDD